jgi:hypothetical protein
MLFGDLTEGSYNFLGGPKVDVCSTSHPNVMSILTLKRGRMGKCMLSAFILEHSTFIHQI